jgi:hypothetical protein
MVRAAGAGHKGLAARMWEHKSAAGSAGFSMWPGWAIQQTGRIRWLKKPHASERFGKLPDAA